LHKNYPKLNEFLSELNINIIKCGAFHSLALTQSGEVYAWD
jgi:alpha-tubulin suppressor-like RCC1 family protein